MLDFDNPFQAAVIALFIVFAVAGVAIFAINPGVFGGSSGQDNASEITMWGTLEESVINDTLNASGINTQDSSITVNYRYVPESDLRSELVNALARDEGPDTLLIPHTRLLQLDEFLVRVGPQAYSPRSFRDNFLEGTEIFSRPDGVIGLPLAVNPLVMYWNRDMLSAAGFVSPPETWGQMPEYTEKINDVNDDRSIDQSALAMGTAANIDASKSILSALLLQAGNPITQIQSSTQRPDSFLAGTAQSTEQAQAALRQYTQYANPQASSYSWNNTFSSAQQAFTANQVAMYLDSGRAITEIRAQNPNLNFDVAAIPQSENGKTRTYGTVYGVAVLQRVSPARKASVFRTVQQLVSREVSESILEETNLVPVRKEVVASASPEAAYKSTLLDAAVTARSWADPDPDQTNNIFERMVTDVISGQRTIRESVDLAHRALQSAFEQLQQE